MTRYANGASHERRTQARWEKDGYWVIRAAGSHGLADLVAHEPHGDRWVLIQCGLGRKSKAEKQALIELAKAHDADAVIVGRGQKEEWLT